MSYRLLIIGWSVRAAAQSAKRAGFTIDSVDAFQDVDLRDASEVGRRFKHWKELPAIVEEFPPSDWLYVGGLENHPKTVARICRRHRLLGTGEQALQRVRDPFALQEALERHGFAMPALSRRRDAFGTASADRWLVKKYASAGGVGVRRNHASRKVPPDCYLQEFVEGAVWGASYLATNRECRLLAVCEQIPQTIDPQSGFRYPGSVGPMSLTPNQADSFQRLGDALVESFELRGVFGVDVVVDSGGSIRPLEINPRYTASMELFERAGGGSLVEAHVRTCRDGIVRPPETAGDGPIQGKQVVYHDPTGPAALFTGDLVESLRSRPRDFADIPMPGSYFAVSMPMITVFAEGPDRASVLEQLRTKADHVQQLVAAGRR